MNKRAIQQAASRVHAAAVAKGVVYAYLRGGIVCIRTDDRVKPGELIGVYTAVATTYEISCDIAFVAGGEQ